MFNFWNSLYLNATATRWARTNFHSGTAIFLLHPSIYPSSCSLLHCPFIFYCVPGIFFCQMTKTEMINCNYWHSLFTRPAILLLISVSCDILAPATAPIAQPLWSKQNKYLGGCECGCVCVCIGAVVICSRDKLPGNLTRHRFYCVWLRIFNQITRIQWATFKVRCQIDWLYRYSHNFPYCQSVRLEMIATVSK